MSLHDCLIKGNNHDESESGNGWNNSHRETCM
jgi:hypothetical protein